MQATKGGEITLKRLMMLPHWWWCLRGPILHSNDQPMRYLYQDSNSVLPTYIFWKSALLLSFFRFSEMEKNDCSLALNVGVYECIFNKNSMKHPKFSSWHHWFQDELFRHPFFGKGKDNPLNMPGMQLLNGCKKKVCMYLISE